jgi:ATP-dependent Clp protease ATP-binding subunit ClpC
MSPLTIASNAVWQLAAQEALNSGSLLLEKEHLLLGICSLEKLIDTQADFYAETQQNFQDEVLAVEALIREAFGTSPRSLHQKLRANLASAGKTLPGVVVHRSPECKRIFQRAAKLAGADAVSCADLLRALLEDPGRQIEPFLLRAAAVQPTALAGTALSGFPQNNVHYLEQYGRNLTQAAREGKLGPLIGRRKEIQQVIAVLLRPEKNNPVLVGEAGVGKTAIAEGLAKWIIQDPSAAALQDKRIVAINLAAIAGDTRCFSDFEGCLNAILAEAQASPDTILFIDQLDMLIASGSEGREASLIFKAALARRDFHCIGAVTLDAFRECIKGSPDLEARFEMVMVTESSREEALEILRGLRPKLEERHHVYISDQALEAAVDLSIRFDPDHQLPDKAIRLLDSAGGRARIPMLSMMTFMDRQDTRAISPVIEVTPETIAQVLADKTSLPYEIITAKSGQVVDSHLLELDSVLKQKIIGQDTAIDLVSQRLLRVQQGQGRLNGPLAVFLFVGPPGVGKTETARSLAEFLFGSELALIRLDMAAFSQQDGLSKLIGSPPGYAGLDEAGQLTSRLRTHPYSVVLLEQVEKAHPQIVDLLWNVFEDGRLTDAKGRSVDTRNTIFILTTNLSSGAAGFEGVDAASPAAAVIAQLNQRFSAEPRNRPGELILFRALDRQDAMRILTRQLDELAEQVQAQYKVLLQFTGEALERLVDVGFIPASGVHNLAYTVEHLVKIPLGALILTGGFESHPRWMVAVQDEQIVITPLK